MIQPLKPSSLPFFWVYWKKLEDFHFMHTYAVSKTLLPVYLQLIKFFHLTLTFEALSLSKMEEHSWHLSNGQKLLKKYSKIVKSLQRLCEAKTWNSISLKKIIIDPSDIDKYIFLPTYIEDVSAEIGVDWAFGLLVTTLLPRLSESDQLHKLIITFENSIHIFLFIIHLIVGEFM